MQPALYEPTEYAVFVDTETPEDEPLFVGTWHECLAFTDDKPHTKIIWYDEDVDGMPSLSIH